MNRKLDPAIYEEYLRQGKLQPWAKRRPWKKTDPNSQADRERERLWKARNPRPHGLRDDS